MIWPFKKKNSTSVPVNNSWWRVLEANTGYWQKNITYERKDVIAHFAVFSCVSLISSDISKLPVRYVKKGSDGIWREMPTGRLSVINGPNLFQNRIQFFENWVTSKLLRGNAYIFKQRDSRGRVASLHVLCPDLVMPLVSDSGEVFYQLSKDNLAGIEDSIVIPASEIIHDRFNCLNHPLVGLSPVFACGVAAYGGIKIIENSANLFGNMSMASGILTAPGAISDETAARLKAAWEENYGGKNYGRTAVLGDDLKYQPIAMTAVDSQLVDQLKLSADIVCSAFHVPSYKVISAPPSFNNIEALDSSYYSQCLQGLIEAIELVLDEGLGVPDGEGFEFDIDVLLRMDTKTQIETLSNAVKGGIMPPNEAMRKLNLPPVTGGDTVYLQQQMYSLEALSKRDASANPFSNSQGSSENAGENNPPLKEDDTQKNFESELLRLLSV